MVPNYHRPSPLRSSIVRAHHMMATSAAAIDFQDDRLAWFANEINLRKANGPSAA